MDLIGQRKIALGHYPVQTSHAWRIKFATFVLSEKSIFIYYQWPREIAKLQKTVLGRRESDKKALSSVQNSRLLRMREAHFLSGSETERMSRVSRYG